MRVTKQDPNAIKKAMSQELDIKLSLRLLPIENKIDNFRQRCQWIARTNTIINYHTR